MLGSLALAQSRLRSLALFFCPLARMLPFAIDETYTTLAVDAEAN
jgi:hypothetical protein